MSNLIPKEFITHVLERTDIVDVINERLALKKRGTNYLACCPFHNEKTPSFTVSQVKQLYHCFGCGVSGSALTFLIEYEKLHFVEAIKSLAERIGLEIPQTHKLTEKDRPHQHTSEYEQAYELLERIAVFYQQQVKISLTATKYIEQRQINQEIMQRYGIAYAPSAWQQLESALTTQHDQNIRQLLIKTGMLITKENGKVYDRFRNRIMFPIRNKRGQIIGFGGRSIDQSEPKYLNSPETFIFHKSQEIYGLFEAQQAIRARQQIIVVEGYMDVVALSQFGIEEAVATLGTAVTQDHLRLLLRYAKKLIFCFDGDTAGRKAAWRALEQALPLLHQGLDIGFVFLPETEDPDTFIRQQGKEMFIKKVEQALGLADFFIKHLLADLDIHTTHGKTQFAQSAKPLLQQMSDPIFKGLLIEQMAKIMRIDTDRLHSLLGFEQTRIGTGSRSVTRTTSPPPSVMRLIIALLLQYPKLIELIKDYPIDSKLPGSNLLLDIIELINSSPNINTGAILERFSGHQQITILKKLANWELNLPEIGLKEEFMDAFRRVHQQSLDLQMEQLLTKANIDGLTEQERLYLHQLIKNKHDPS